MTITFDLSINKYLAFIANKVSFLVTFLDILNNF